MKIDPNGRIPAMKTTVVGRVYHLPIDGGGADGDDDDDEYVGDSNGDGGYKGNSVHADGDDNIAYKGETDGE
jgi:hypothetical protein